MDKGLGNREVERIHTQSQNEYRLRGLRILARIIARMHLGHIRLEAEELCEKAEET